jgi:uncharacterized protein
MFFKLSPADKTLHTSQPMHTAFEKMEHRPWPVPQRPWTWRQSWRDLLFAHWPIAASALRPFVPESLEIQEFDGTSWVGIVPFRMTGVMRRPFPDLPWLSAFPELNLRVYVTCENKPGVWFISLDATQPLAIWGARRFFHLPYFQATMQLKQHGQRLHYISERCHAAPRVAFRGTYEPVSSCYLSQPGTLEHFLTERYCLYAQDRSGQLWRGEVQHHPWPLQRATLEIEENTIATAQGIAISGEPALLHFSQAIHVVVWPLERVFNNR